MQNKNTRYCVTNVLPRQEMDKEVSGKQRSTMECSSPRRIIARLFSRMNVRKRVSNKVKTAPGRGRENVIQDKVVTGNNKVENVVNLGVACSLFYLTMASKNEIEKMKELQRDTRVLLGEIKEELRRKNRAQETVESPTSCLTDAGRRLRTPFVLTEEGTVGGEREKLEVELETELERLQIHLDSESSSRKGHQIAPKANSDLQGGVSAVELERKLHELLESRQEEQIKELEDAVVYYKSELCKKEREISWWRNTAMLISHRANEAKLMIWPE